MSEAETIRCNWCGKARRPSAYAGDFEFPGMVDICQYCRGVETRRNGTADRTSEWVAKELDLQRQADQIEAILKKPLQGEKKGNTVFEL
jgi:hypothetical protein